MHLFQSLVPPAIPPTANFTYAELRACGNAYNERNDCSVIATSAITGYPYPRVHEMYRVFGRRKRCRTPWVYTVGVFAQLGLRLAEITHFYHPSSVRALTPQLPSTGSFLIRTSTHVCAVKDGVIQDWAEQHKLYVKQIFQVVDLDEPLNLAPPPPPKRKVYIDYSQPTKAVWAIAEILMDSETPPSTPTRRYWSTFRAKVVAESVNNGINKTTAAVQVGKWMADSGLHMGYMAK